MEPAIIVHGGVRGGLLDIPVDMMERTIEGVKRAVREGYRVLQNGGSSIDAVVAAVTVMEDDTAFNCGNGGSLTKKGEVELDAIVIDGKTLNSGAVCSVQDIANPVQLARKVMDETDHCLLSGGGASDFATEQGIPRISSHELVTPEAKACWEECMEYADVVKDSFNFSSRRITECDTVGAVALDKDGNVASATSTGGIPAQMPGRVGDAPIIGSGAYADNDVGGASSSGHGESIMKVCLTRRVGEYLEKGLSVKDATKAALEFMGKRVGAAGGVIAIDSKTGEVARHFSTELMIWASIEHGQLHYGLHPEENICQPI